MHVHHYEHTSKTLFVSFYGDLVEDEQSKFLLEWATDTPRDMVLGLKALILDFRRVDSVDLDNTDSARVSLWLRLLCDALILSEDELEALLNNLPAVRLVDSASAFSQILIERVRRSRIKNPEISGEVTDNMKRVANVTGLELSLIERVLTSLYAKQH